MPRPVHTPPTVQFEEVTNGYVPKQKHQISAVLRASEVLVKLMQCLGYFHVYNNRPLRLSTPIFICKKLEVHNTALNHIK